MYEKFQTYSNFLKGEEKEQYEEYLENRRKMLSRSEAKRINREQKEREVYKVIQ